MQPNEGEVRPGEVEERLKAASCGALFIRAAAAAPAGPQPAAHSINCLCCSVAPGSSPLVLSAYQPHYESKSGGGGGKRGRRGVKSHTETRVESQRVC